MLDEYCERLGPGLWAEPWNAITNLAFIIAAVLLWRLFVRVKPAGQRPLGDIWLISLVAVIGIGSGLYHTFATHWALWMDVIPILIFQISLLWIYLRRIAGATWYWALLLMGLFFAANYLSGLFPDLLNGSMMYAPAVLSVLVLGVYHRITQPAVGQSGYERWGLLAAFVVFCCSLTFRSIDDALCSQWPLGTHFMWHVLNGVVLYLASRAVITARPVSD